MLLKQPIHHAAPTRNTRTPSASQPNIAANRAASEWERFVEDVSEALDRRLDSILARIPKEQLQ